MMASATDERAAGSSGQSLNVQVNTRTLGTRPHHQQSPASSSAHSWQTAVAGGIAGATAKTFTAPLGRLTILYQVSLTRKEQLAESSCIPSANPCMQPQPAVMYTVVVKPFVNQLLRAPTVPGGPAMAERKISGPQSVRCVCSELQD